MKKVRMLKKELNSIQNQLDRKSLEKVKGGASTRASDAFAQDSCYSRGHLPSAY